MCPAKHLFGLSEYLSRLETEFAEDPFGSPEVLRRRRARKSHYITPPLVLTNLESRLIIKLVDDR
jgi:hypothetical protein